MVDHYPLFEFVYDIGKVALCYVALALDWRQRERLANCLSVTRLSESV